MTKLAGPSAFSQGAIADIKFGEAAWPNLYTRHPLEKLLNTKSVVGQSASKNIWPLSSGPMRTAHPNFAQSVESPSVRNAKLHLSPAAIQKLAGPNHASDGLPVDRRNEWKPVWSNVFSPAPLDPVAHTYGFGKHIIDSTVDFAQHLSKTYWTMKVNGELEPLSLGVFQAHASASAVMYKAVVQPMLHAALDAVNDLPGTLKTAADSVSQFSRNYAAGLTNPQHTERSSMALGAQSAALFLGFGEFFKQKGKVPGSDISTRKPDLDGILARSPTATQSMLLKHVQSKTQPNQRTGEPTTLYSFSAFGGQPGTPSHGFSAMYSDNGPVYPNVQLVLDMRVAPNPEARRALGSEFLMTKVLLEKLKSDGKNPNRAVYIVSQNDIDAAKASGMSNIGEVVTNLPTVKALREAGYTKIEPARDHNMNGRLIVFVSKEGPASPVDVSR